MKVFHSQKLKRLFSITYCTLRGVKNLDYEAVENFDEKLDDCNTLADIFELVKQSVKRFLNRHRSGLMLGLADLGMKQGYFVGAFHLVGSNIIVMNRASMETALQTVDKKIFNAYCFHLLLHEYLHSFGYVDEEEVRDLTQEVCRLALGNGHPATVMAEQGIAVYFPKVTYFTRQSSLPSDIQIELVKDFDSSSVGYIH